MPIVYIWDRRIVQVHVYTWARRMVQVHVYIWDRRIVHVYTRAGRIVQVHVYTQDRRIVHVYTWAGRLVHMFVPGLGGYCALLPQAFLADRYSMKPCWASPGCHGHCSQNSRDAPFFLCGQVLSGPQISRTCLRSSVTRQKSCLPRGLSDWVTLQVTSLWSLVVRIVL